MRKDLRERAEPQLGRRFMPPLRVVPIQRTEEPRREDPGSGARTRPAPVQGSFTPRFRMSVSGVDVGRQRCILKTVTRRVCVHDPAPVLSARILLHDSVLVTRDVASQLPPTTMQSSRKSWRSCRPTDAGRGHAMDWLCADRSAGWTCMPVPDDGNLR